MQHSMSSSKGLLMLQRSPSIWNPQASINLMASELTEPPLFLGEVGKWWCGMPLAPIHCPPSYTSLATREANVVVIETEKQKKAQYASHHFVLIAVKSLWVFGAEARILLQDLERSLKDSTSEPLPHHHPIQRISMAVQGATQLPS